MENNLVLEINRNKELMNINQSILLENATTKIASLLNIYFKKLFNIKDSSYLQIANDILDDMNLPKIGNAAQNIFSDDQTAINFMFKFMNNSKVNQAIKTQIIVNVLNINPSKLNKLIAFAFNDEKNYPLIINANSQNDLNAIFPYFENQLELNASQVFMTDNLHFPSNQLKLFLYYFKQWTKYGGGSTTLNIDTIKDKIKKLNTRDGSTLKHIGYVYSVVFEILKKQFTSSKEVIEVEIVNKYYEYVGNVLNSKNQESTVNIEKIFTDDITKLLSAYSAHINDLALDTLYTVCANGARTSREIKPLKDLIDKEIFGSTNDKSAAIKIINILYQYIKTNNNALAGGVPSPLKQNWDLLVQGVRPNPFKAITENSAENTKIIAYLKNGILSQFKRLWTIAKWGAFPHPYLLLHIVSHFRKTKTPFNWLEKFAPKTYRLLLIYMTWVIFNILRRIVLTIIIPIINGIGFLIGMGFDAVYEKHFPKGIFGYAKEGFISNEDQIKGSKSLLDFIAGEIFWKHAVNNVMNSSNSFGKNFWNFVAPPELTNFKNGLVYRALNYCTKIILSTENSTGILESINKYINSLNEEASKINPEIIDKSSNYVKWERYDKKFISVDLNLNSVSGFFFTKLYSKEDLIKAGTLKRHPKNQNKFLFGLSEKFCEKHKGNFEMTINTTGNKKYLLKL